MRLREDDRMRTIGDLISKFVVSMSRKAVHYDHIRFCLRDKLKIPHGQRYELCRSVHAEQNAIINAARAGVSLLGGDIYLYGSIPGKDGPIDALPCFICKKMIINAGLKRVICSTSEGKLVIFSADDWTDEWQKNDIIDDKHQYG